MSDEHYENIWIKDNNVSFYREVFKHSFNNSEISFVLTKINDAKTPLHVSVCNGFKLTAGDDILTVPYRGDITAAKKMIDDSIKHFDQEQKINIYKIKNYFNSYEQKVSLERNNINSKEKNMAIQNQVKTPTYRVHIPHIPMKHINGGIQAGLLQIKEEMINNGESPPLERRNINSKEKIMSDVDEREEISADDYLASLNTTVPLAEEKKELSPKEQAYRDAVITAKHQRKVVADALKAGTLSCLPGKDGYADTTPAVNIMNPDKPYHAEAQLFLKAVQKQEQNGFPTAEYVTYHQIDKAREDGVKVFPREGIHGEALIIGEKKETGEWENKKIILFNVAQTNNPKALKEWAEKEIEKQEQKELEYKQTIYGSGYQLPEKKAKEPGQDIVCSSTEPAKYLGQYLAAVSMRSKFKVTPEQAAEFSEKMLKALYEPMQDRTKENGEIIPAPLNKETGQPISDPFNFEKISRAANAECKTFMKDTRMQTQKQNQKHKQEQKQEQSIGRSM